MTLFPSSVKHYCFYKPYKWIKRMTVATPLIDVKELSAKVTGNNRYAYETKVANKLRDLVKGVENYEKEVETRRKQLEKFQNEIENIMTEEQLISYCKNSGW